MNFYQHFSYKIQWIVIFILGLFNVLAFAPYHLWPIPLVSMIFFLGSLSGKSLRQAAGLGYAYGLGWFGAGINWVFVSIDRFGGFPLPISLLIIGLLIAYLALFPALTAGLIQRFIPQKHGFWLIAPIWIFSEWLRSWLLTGFPWLSLGYSQLYGPLKSFAPVIGEIGLSYLIVTIAALIIHFRYQLRSYFAITTAIFIVLSSIGLSQIQWVKPTQETVRIAMVQGNILQELRWIPENELPTMQKYWQLSLPYLDDIDLLIWPEAAIPRLESLAQNFLYDIDRDLALFETSLITGIIDYQYDFGDIYNGLIVVGKKHTDSTLGHYRYLHNNRYYKHHLLPIGEFVPLESWLRQLGPLFDLPMSSFDRGNKVQHPLVANDLYLTPALCYEIAFSEQIFANFTQQTDFLLTVSNDAWFGESLGPLQHMEIAQMRALEFGRPLLRATNNGVTAIADAKGNIIARLPQFKKAVLRQDVSKVTGITPYALFGPWLIYIWSLSLLLLFAIKKYLSRKNTD